MIKYFIALFLLIAFYFEVVGQKDTLKVVSLQEVVVTSQRTPMRQFEIPHSVLSIGRKELDNFNPRTTPEALTRSTGVFVQNTNHGGGSPIIRGLTGNQTLLLIDGVRLNNSIYRYGPNQYLNTIDQFSIDKIEVAKGTGAVQYGTDALGGALQILTREPSFSRQNDIFHGNLLGKYMTGDMEKTGRGELDYSSKKFAALIGITYRDFGDLIGGKETGKQSPSGYSEFSFDAKLKFALKEDVQLTIANQFTRQNQVPLYHKVVLENYTFSNFDPQQRMLTYARLTIQGHQKLLDQIKISTSWQQGIEGRNSQKNGSSVVLNERDEINTVGFTSDVSSRMNDVWTAVSGVEFYHDKVGSARSEININLNGAIVNNRGLYPDDSKFGNYSIFSLHHLDFGKVIFDGGMRYSYFRISISDVTLGKVIISPRALVFNAAAMFLLNQNHRIYATFSNGFRAPNIDDMGSLGIVDFRYEMPAYHLKPEKSQNYEAGYKLLSQTFNGTFAAYYINLNQLITRVKSEGQFIDGYQVYKKENVEKAFIKGFEANFNWRPLSSLEMDGGITYTYGQNITNNEPMRRIPPLNGRVAATYSVHKFFLCAEFLFASKQDRLSAGDKSDNRISVGGTPGWQVINLYTGYQLASIKMKIGWQNLLDTDYRTHGSGINGLGRSAWFSVNYSF